MIVILTPLFPTSVLASNLYSRKLTQLLSAFTEPCSDISDIVLIIVALPWASRNWHKMLLQNLQEARNLSRNYAHDASLF